MNNLSPITVSVMVHATTDKAWRCFTSPEHIVHWNKASDDWHSPSATSNLTAGGSFSYRMEALDGSVGFDFEGTFTEVKEKMFLEYVLGDGRKVSVSFINENGLTKVSETFDPENIHPAEMQRAGWQSILDNYKQYTENLKDQN